MIDSEILERNLELQTAFMEYLGDHPDILDYLPDDFRLVILPDDDPELGQRNLELLSQQGDADKSVVIARLRARQPRDWKENPPQVYLPVKVTS